MLPRTRWDEKRSKAGEEARGVREEARTKGARMREEAEEEEERVRAEAREIKVSARLCLRPSYAVPGTAYQHWWTEVYWQTATRGTDLVGMAL